MERSTTNLTALYRSISPEWMAPLLVFLSHKGRSKSANVTDDFSAQVEYAQNALIAANAASPQLFRYMDGYAAVDRQRGRVRILEDERQLFTVIAKATTWEREIGNDGATRQVSPPADVVKFIAYDTEFCESLPEFAGVVTTPFFAADGALVLEPGYHAGARVFLAGDTVSAGVSPNPTPEEVDAAKRLLIEDVLADFPLGGMTRAEILAATGEQAAPVAHTLPLSLGQSLHIRFWSLPFAPWN